MLKRCTRSLCYIIRGLVWRRDCTPNKGKQIIKSSCCVLSARYTTVEQPYRSSLLTTGSSVASVADGFRGSLMPVEPDDRGTYYVRAPENGTGLSVLVFYHTSAQS